MELFHIAIKYDALPAIANEVNMYVIMYARDSVPNYSLGTRATYLCN